MITHNTLPGANLREVERYLNEQIDNYNANNPDNPIKMDGGMDLGVDACSMTEFPSYRWIACYAVVGGSEGHYIHVNAIYSDQHKSMFIGKTFAGFDHALFISNLLAKWLWAGEV